MASTFDCLTVYDLEPFRFIGGTEQTLGYYMYDQTSGCPLDITTAQCSVIISPYGNPNYVTLVASGSPTGSPVNYFIATISGCATQLISGKFVQQPRIIDIDGGENTPSQGLLQIDPRNATV
jgi:hypothetical protein